MNDHETFCSISSEALPTTDGQPARRWWLPLDAEEEYLAAASDLADLERRMRVLDRASGGWFAVTFNH